MDANCKIGYKKIGIQIKLHRDKMKITQEKLAERAQLSTSHISNIENGTANISINALIRITNALNTTTDQLLADNLKCNLLPIQNRIAEELEDCSYNEMIIISDIVSSLKKSIRERCAFPQDSEQNR